jgi:Polyprenyl synthetase
MDENRKQGMEITRRRIVKELKRVITKLQLHPETEAILFRMPKHRSKAVTIRGFFAHMIYEYTREQARTENLSLLPPAKRVTLFHTQIPFLIECVMSVQYLENQVLDGKDGVLTERGLEHQKIIENLCAFSFLKDFLYRYIEKDLKGLNLRQRSMVAKTVRRMCQYVTLGQVAEKTYATHENFRRGFETLPTQSTEIEAFIDHDLIEDFWQRLRQAGIKDELESYTKFYLRRVWLTNVALFVLTTEMICALMGYEGEEVGNLRRFAIDYAYISQLMNDLCDFVPAYSNKGTATKRPEDAFSDLRNGNITLPLIFLASTDCVFDTKQLAENIYTEAKQNEVFKLIRPICFFEVVPFLQAFANDSVSRLNGKNDFAKLLGDLAGVAYSPRYLKPFKSKNHEKSYTLPCLQSSNSNSTSLI